MHRLFFSIKRVHWLWDRKAREILRDEHGPHCTPAEFNMLRTLFTYRNGLVRFKLARLLGVAAPGVSRMVKRLEDDWLVERSRPYKDKRLVRVKLTSSGVAFMERLLREVYDFDLDGRTESVSEFTERNVKEWFASTELPDVELGLVDQFLIRARVKGGDRAIYPVPWHGGEVFPWEPGTIEEPPPTRFRVAA